jgi:orotidine-5'-phosphate decarboxylase
MLEAAVDAVERSSTRLGLPRPKVLGVTILTHLHVSDLIEIGFAEPRSPQYESDSSNSWINGHVRQLARLCQEAGLDGVVASPHEVRAIREETGPNFLIITPGIRPAGVDMHDQVRVATPTRAMRAGASYLVVGRPITTAPDPLDAARKVIREMEDAFLIA